MASMGIHCTGTVHKFIISDLNLFTMAGLMVLDPGVTVQQATWEIALLSKDQTCMEVSTTEGRNMRWNYYNIYDVKLFALW